MTNDLSALVERWRLAARHAVELDEVAAMAEASRKATRAEIVNHLEGSMAARESIAENHPRYQEKVADALSAKSRANLQDVEANALKMEWESARSAMANDREERRMHR